MELSSISQPSLGQRGTDSGPSIKDWPKMYRMEDNMLLELAAVIHDSVTTTDELIPSGETSSYRSNPLKLSEFALSRRVPEYVGLSKRIQEQDHQRRDGKCPQKTLTPSSARRTERSAALVLTVLPSSSSVPTARISQFIAFSSGRV